MIRITIIADSVDELRRFLNNKVAESKYPYDVMEPTIYKPTGPITYKDVKDIAPWPTGSYKPRHAKTGAVDGRPR